MPDMMSHARRARVRDITRRFSFVLDAAIRHARYF